MSLRFLNIFARLRLLEYNNDQLLRRVDVLEKFISGELTRQRDAMNHPAPVTLSDENEGELWLTKK
jgi:hypothetical protein